LHRITLMRSIEMSNPASRRCFVLIASGHDETYLRRGTLTAMRSILKSNPGVPVVVLHHDLSTAQEKLFSDATLTRVGLSDFQLSAYSTLARRDIPRTVFLSLYVERLEQFDVAIYVDADAVVLESLEGLFSIEAPLAARVMNENPLVEHFEDGVSLLRREGVDGVHALNNGLVRFDLDYWRRNGLLDQAASLYRRHGPDAFRFADQSLLNLIAYKTRGFRPLSRTYNFCRYPDMFRMEHGFATNVLGLVAPRIDEGLVKVVHWTGPVKPWSAAVELIDNPRVAMCLDCYEQFSA